MLQTEASLSVESKVLSIGLALIRYFEGCRLKPYLCQAGVPTIGFGSIRYEDGMRVTLKDKPITLERAQFLLMNDIRKIYLPTVMLLCPTLRSPEQIAAILSWTYNLGGTNLKTSTMRRKILSEIWEDVPYELRKWNKAAGKVSKGLVKRRDAESALFILG